MGTLSSSAGAVPLLAALTLALTLLLSFAVVPTSAADESDACAAVTAAAEQWLLEAGAPLDLLRFSPSGTLVAAEELRPRTVVHTVPRSLLFGWEVEAGDDDLDKERAQVALAGLLLRELTSPSPEWAPLLSLLHAHIPRYALSTSGKLESLSPCVSEWGTPALLWNEKELSHAAESLLVTAVPAWKERIEELYPNENFADALWAHSVTLGRSVVVFDGAVRRLVLAPIASNLRLGLRSRTSFAFSGADQELRFWVDDLYYEGDEVAALYAPLTTLQSVLFFGYHEQVNPLERVPLDLFLDVHDPNYAGKKQYLSTANLLEEEQYPLGRLFYAEITGMVSPESMALLRMKHYIAAKHARPASSDPREKERLKRETVLADHQIRPEEERALYPNPLTLLHKANELAAVQELAAMLNSRLDRHFSTDLAADQALYSRPPPAGQELDKQLLNAVAVRLVEKDLLGKAHRRLARRLQQLASEAFHSTKKSTQRSHKKASLDALKPQRGTLLD